MSWLLQIIISFWFLVCFSFKTNPYFKHVCHVIHLPFLMRVATNNLPYCVDPFCKAAFLTPTHIPVAISYVRTFLLGFKPHYIHGAPQKTKVKTDRSVHCLQPLCGIPTSGQTDFVIAVPCVLMPGCRSMTLKTYIYKQHVHKVEFYVFYCLYWLTKVETVSSTFLFCQINLIRFIWMEYMAMQII